MPRFSEECKHAMRCLSTRRSISIGSYSAVDLFFEIIGLWWIWNTLMAWPDWPWPTHFTTDLCHCLYAPVQILYLYLPSCTRTCTQRVKVRLQGGRLSQWAISFVTDWLHDRSRRWQSTKFRFQGMLQHRLRLLSRHFWFLLLSTDPLSPKKLKLFAQHSRSRSTSDRNSINAVEKVSGDGLWWQQLLSDFLAKEQTKTWFAVWTCIKSHQCAKRICRAYLRLWWTCLDSIPLPNDWRDFVIACLAQLLTFNMTVCSVKVWCTSRV